MTLLSKLHEPEKTGHSYEKNEEEETPHKTTNEGIHTINYFFISVFISRIDEKSKISKLFSTWKENTNSDFSVRHLICPLFFTAVLVYHFIYFIKSGNKNGKRIFHIDDGSVFGSLKQNTCDNKTILDKLKPIENKTNNLIQHILDNDIKPDEGLCIEYELLFINFFNNTYALFQKTLPVYDISDNFKNNYNNRKEIESQIDKSMNPEFF